MLSVVIERLGPRREECYFWATHAGAELHLLVVRGRHRRGFEFKLSESPEVTRPMQTALEDLRLDGLDVIHAGRDTFSLAGRVRAVAASRLLDDLKPLG